MVLKLRIPTEEYMESIHVMNGSIYFGGENTQLLSIDSNKPELQIREHKGCTDNGISKIMGVTLGHSHYMFVLSFEQNLTLLKVCPDSLKF